MKRIGNLNDGHGFSHELYLPNRKFWLPLLWLGTVANFVCFILRCRLPRKVSRIYAAKMPISAFMSSMMLCGWRMSMRLFAHDTMNLLRLPLPLYGASPQPAFRIWPGDAFFCCGIQSGKKEFHWNAARDRAF